MAHSLAIARVLEHDFGVSLAAKGEAVAGHSLGEYSALAAVGAFSLADTARLLKLRGRAMQAAVPVGVGGMCALLGADLEKATALAEAAAGGEVCEVANDNDPGQVVLSGHVAAIARAVELAKEYGCKRAVLLPVSAPFHCSLMQPAADAMAEALALTPPQPLALPVYSNFTATLTSDPAVELELLVKQVTGRVRWRESMEAMGAAGITHFVELGGNVVGPMIRKIVAESTQTSVVSMDELEALAKEIG
jgi:[acyl-carrier-protein] S-malonyltransferase